MSRPLLPRDKRCRIRDLRGAVRVFQRSARAGEAVQVPQYVVTRSVDLATRAAERLRLARSEITDPSNGGWVRRKREALRLAESVLQLLQGVKGLVGQPELELITAAEAELLDVRETIMSAGVSTASQEELPGAPPAIRRRLRRAANQMQYDMALPVILTAALVGASVCGAFGLAPVWAGFLIGFGGATALTAAAYSASL